MANPYLLSSLIAASLAGLSACGGGGGGGDTPPTDDNIKPIAVIDYQGSIELSKGSEITFDASLSEDEDGSIEQYTWSNGELTKQGKQATFSFDTLGDISISLTVTDNDGASTTEVLKLKVVEPSEAQNPVAKISASSLEINVDQSIDFGSESTDADGSISSYQWKLGTTLISEDKAFSYKFTEEGVQTISLTVTDNDGLSDTTEQEITVNPAGSNLPPLAKISELDLSIDVDTEISLSAAESTDPDGTISSYEWKLGSTLISQDKTFSYKFSEEGVQSISLTVTDNEGLSATTEQEITVLPVGSNVPPVAKISELDLPVDVDTEISFSAAESTDPDGSISTYEWLIEGKSYTGENITHTFTEQGDFSVSLTVTDNDAAQNSVELSVQVVDPNTNLPPSADIQMSTSSVEVGGSLTFDGSASSDPENKELVFDWDGQSSSSTFSQTFTKAGTEKICLTVSDPEGASDTQCVNISVTEPASSTVVYYKTADAFTNIHYWNVTPSTIAATTWPGEVMEDIGDGWYSYDFGSFIDSASIVFNDGGDGKTLDLSFDPAKPCYQGEWVSMADCEIEDTKAPVISALPAAGNYEESSLSVALSVEDQDDNVQLYYTLDGSTPTSSSTLYSTEIKLSDEAATGIDATIKAYAIDSAGNESSVIEFAYKLNEDATPPVVSTSLDTGTYPTAQNITLSATDNRDAEPKLYFTTDGSAATSSSTLYDNDDIQLVEGSNSISVLAVDSAGNQKLYSFNYFIGEKPPRNDFREESIYFLMTTRFYDGDPSNNVKSWAGVNNAADDPAWRGDLVGLIDKLDYIKALGFSAIWITPPVKNVSAYDYHGYHAVDFTEIDPRFDSNGNGSAMDEYQLLIDEIHKRDMKLIQDIVLNHTSNYGEENLFPMFEKDANGNYTGTGQSTDQLTPNSFLLQSAGGNYYDLPEYNAGSKQEKRIQAMANPASDPDGIYHDNQIMTPDWSGIGVQNDYLAVDCIDLDTESPKVQEYLINAYKTYMDMGVDAFRVDTVKHINRLMFNEVFIPAFKEHGGEDFYIFGENAARYWGRWSENVPSISPSFYSWKEDPSLTWDLSSHDASINATEEHFAFYRSDYEPPVKGTPNHQLEGNDYHVPDWSMRSGLDQIDFPMHWAFKDANKAFEVALTYDSDYSDATWNVTYVDSHDYAPDNAPEGQRFAMEQEVWAENLSLLFTFRGIPTIYYGSEIEFKKGEPIDKGATIALENSGRAYFGAHIEGTVTASDFGEYEASGAVKDSLEYPLAQHIIALNKLRRAIPALQKGQYSTEGVNGGLAFKRRFTENGVDSMALVVVSGSATFTGVPSGDWVDVITGDTQSGTSVSANAGGKGSLRVYVLNGSKIDGLTGPYIK